MLISFAVTAKLICAFVFAHAESRFSHDAAVLKYSYNARTSPYTLILKVTATTRDDIERKWFGEYVHACLLGTKKTPNTIPNYSAHCFVIWSCSHGHFFFITLIQLEHLSVMAAYGITHQDCIYGFADCLCT